MQQTPLGNDVDDASVSSRRATRRAVIAGAGAAAVVVLGGCATYDQTAPTGGGAGNGDGDGGGGGGGGEPDPDGGGGGAPAPLAQTGEIPVGGGKVFDQRRIVVTQPVAGTFAAFSAVCTHQGCVVADVSNGTINCPCHGSRFTVADGSVAQGPAGGPLRKVNITVSGTDILVA